MAPAATVKSLTERFINVSVPTCYYIRNQTLNNLCRGFVQRGVYIYLQTN